MKKRSQKRRKKIRRKIKDQDCLIQDTCRNQKLKINQNHQKEKINKKVLNI